MIEVNSPLGNVFEDKKFESHNFEKLKISRIELEKKILRRKTDHGTDVGLRLDHGIRLHHGDIIKNDQVRIVVEQIPEKVISVKVTGDKNFQVMTMIGHMIGNMHRPLSIQDEEILFPIQDESEKETFEKLFSTIRDKIEMKIENRIFLPYLGGDVHEH